MNRTKSHFLFGSKRQAKLARLKRKGLLPSKAELATLCATAAASATPTLCKPGKPPRRSKYDRSGHILRG